MKVLHLFELYLPHTMNWAYRMIRATPGTTPWVAAPWFVRNEFYDPLSLRTFIRPFQRATGCLPKDEWHHEWFSRLVRQGERVWPLYRNWLSKQLRRERPDVLHAHFAPAGCHYVEMAQRLDIPLVVSFYGYDYERLPFERPAYREKYRALFQGASAVTTTGELTAKIPAAQGCPPEKVTAIPLSIHPEEFPFVQRIKKKGQLRMVQIATVTEKKGYMDTLRAFQSALPDCPGLHLTLAGERQDKHLASRMKAFIAEHDLGKHVAWLDFLPHHTLPDFLGRFDLFIHPSHRTAVRDCEGAPAVILEAQSTGLPVLSTRHADIPKQVLHNKTGLLVEERDTTGLTAHIRRFYFMENTEYQQFSENAHRHIEVNFDVKKTALHLQHLYRKIVAHKPSVAS